MPKFERNDISLIDKQIREGTANPKIGRVQTVYEHGGVDDDSNFEVDVAIDGGTEKEQYVPVITDGSSAIDVPMVGDKVIMYYTDEQNPKPHAAETVWSNKDRPPVGRAGMWRREFESDTSPAGDGNLYVTGYTSYDKNAANTSKYNTSPEKSLVQIAKHTNGSNVDPTDQDDIPLKVEVYDSPKDDESHVILSFGNDNGQQADKRWGMKFNIADGTWKIVDPEGFGIEASGDGDFTWHYSSLTENQTNNNTGPLSL